MGYWSLGCESIRRRCDRASTRQIACEGVGGGVVRNCSVVHRSWSRFEAVSLTFRLGRAPGAYVLATELGEYNWLCGIALRVINRSIFAGSTSRPLTANCNSPLSVSRSLRRCRSLTMPFISLGLTFLSKPHCVIRSRYWRTLQQDAYDKHIHIR